MFGMGNMLIYLVSCCVVCSVILSHVVKMVKKVWWNPIRIQSMMRRQGIKGPCYRFVHGNSKEIQSMEANAKVNPIQLSHHHQVLPAVLPHIYAWNKLYGGNFLYWRGPQPYITVTEPELVKEILNDRYGNFPKEEADSYSKKLLGDGIIVTTTAEKWTKLRKLSNHAFHSESLKGMVPAMVASVEMMLERWKKHESEEIEVFQEFKVLTCEAISKTAFGSSYVKGQQIFHMFNRLAVIVSTNRYNIRLPLIRMLVKTEDDKESERMEQEIRKCVMNMIKERDEKEWDNFGNDFLGILLKAHHENDMSKKISIDDLIDECKNFYVAGQETTTSSLTWTVFLLAIHTDWQHKARQEVVELFGHGNNPSTESLPKLKTMNMIINEALRLYPPVVALPGRHVKREMGLGKLVIPAKVKMEVPILALHHDSKIWGQDVHQFKPQRFAEGIAKATNNNNGAAYLPFGLGSRSCVGSNFAITETKIALSMILQRYRFELSPTYIHSPYQLLTMCPQHGLQIILHPL